MSGYDSIFVTDRHAYTRSREPWRLETDAATSGVTAGDRRGGWRLFRYLASGGMRTFGRSVSQDERDRRQRRFLITAAAVGVIWAALWWL